MAALAGDPGAKVLAGGQSLVLELVYRDSRPRVVVDVNRVAGLDHVGGDEAAATRKRRAAAAGGEVVAAE